jgi:hypothetical protein
VDTSALPKNVGIVKLLNRDNSEHDPKYILAKIVQQPTRVSGGIPGGTADVIVHDVISKATQVQVERDLGNKHVGSSFGTTTFKAVDGLAAGTLLSSFEGVNLNAELRNAFAYEQALIEQNGIPCFSVDHLVKLLLGPASKVSIRKKITINFVNSANISYTNQDGTAIVENTVIAQLQGEPLRHVSDEDKRLALFVSLITPIRATVTSGGKQVVIDCPVGSEMVVPIVAKVPDGGAVAPAAAASAAAAPASAAAASATAAPASAAAAPAPPSAGTSMTLRSRALPPSAASALYGTRAERVAHASTLRASAAPPPSAASSGASSRASSGTDPGTPGTPATSMYSAALGPEVGKGTSDLSSIPSDVTQTTTNPIQLARAASPAARRSAALPPAEAWARENDLLPEHIISELNTGNITVKPGKTFEYTYTVNGQSHVDTIVVKQVYDRGRVMFETLKRTINGVEQALPSGTFSKYTAVQINKGISDETLKVVRDWTPAAPAPAAALTSGASAVAAPAPAAASGAPAPAAAAPANAAAALAAAPAPAAASGAPAPAPAAAAPTSGASSAAGADPAQLTDEQRQAAIATLKGILDERRGKIIPPNANDAPADLDLSDGLDQLRNTMNQLEYEALVHEVIETIPREYNRVEEVWADMQVLTQFLNKVNNDELKTEIRSKLEGLTERLGSFNSSPLGVPLAADVAPSAATAVPIDAVAAAVPVANEPIAAASLSGRDYSEVYIQKPEGGDALADSYAFKPQNRFDETLNADPTTPSQTLMAVKWNESLNKWDDAALLKIEKNAQNMVQYRLFENLVAYLLKSNGDIQIFRVGDCITLPTRNVVVNYKISKFEYVRAGESIQIFGRKINSNRSLGDEKYVEILSDDTQKCTSPVLTGPITKAEATVIVSPSNARLLSSDEVSTGADPLGAAAPAAAPLDAAAAVVAPAAAPAAPPLDAADAAAPPLDAADAAAPVVVPAADAPPPPVPTINENCDKTRIQSPNVQKIVDHMNEFIKTHGGFQKFKQADLVKIHKKIEGVIGGAEYVDIVNPMLRRGSNDYDAFGDDCGGTHIITIRFNDKKEYTSNEFREMAGGGMGTAFVFLIAVPGKELKLAPTESSRTGWVSKRDINKATDTKRAAAVLSSAASSRNLYNPVKPRGIGRTAKKGSGRKQRTLKRNRKR